ncbi:FxLD family lanthipeptide [Streptomyces sp. BI20]|uniref:FxLD family lanthipeptide n=1 Tax=Streptomyces sp. BI20 TaxID=3403460 RepID=UPI003C732F91
MDRFENTVAPKADDGWTLDVQVVADGAVTSALFRNTDDGCGSTCPNACASGGAV